MFSWDPILLLMVLFIQSVFVMSHRLGESSAV